jgi:benzoyl-CoA reductase/2-hydroxyglutaryl-CoA dehydratase subunit BcrC/BadD/HgdB
MSFMREQVETDLKPALERARAGLIPNGHLLADGIQIAIDRYKEIFRAMDEGHKKLGWYEFCLTPELFLAMDIVPFLGETHPGGMIRGNPEVCWEYVDVAEAAGVPPELCVLDIGYQMFEQLTDAPVLRLDAPVDDSPEAHGYYAKELHKLVGFLEEQTGTRLDPDRLREVCEESNRATEAFIELYELRRVRPCPHGAQLSNSAYGATLTAMGTPQLTRYLELLRDDAARAVEEGRGAVPDERHRVFWYYVQVGVDPEMYQWLEESFKVVVIMDVLFSYLREDPIDTHSVDSMLLGLARRGLETTMARVRVTGRKMTEQFLRDYEALGADCVIFPAPAGCKHVWGWLSLLRETCRERGIPVCAFDLDFMDSRVRSVDSIRSTIEQFFTTVME